MRLVIYEDKDMLRESLKAMLSAMPGIEIAGDFNNCETVEQDILQLKPDVVLMDIDMPVKDGIYGVEKIKTINPEINVIMHTVFDDDSKIFRSIEAGADGYLLKNTTAAKLHEAIIDVTLGSSPISPGVARKVLNAFQNKPRKQNFDLTKREKQLLQLLVEGYTYKRISRECFISMDTVRSHLKNIYTKLQVNTGKEAIAKALKHRIVTD